MLMKAVVLVTLVVVATSAVPLDPGILRVTYSCVPGPRYAMNDLQECAPESRYTRNDLQQCHWI
jgi:hypothetical protein